MNNIRFIFYSGLVTCLLLFLFAQVATPLVQKNKASYNLPIHKTLYLSKDIEPDEMFHIMLAAEEWKDVTNSQVIFDVKPLLDPALVLSDSIVIVNVESDYPQVISLDRVKGYQTLGYYTEDRGIDYIALVYERINDADLTQVILHELGHSLGLKHLEGIDGINTLMFPTIDEASAHITKTDFLQFCDLYKCNPEKFHEFP